MTAFALAVRSREAFQPGMAGLERTVARMTAAIREGATNPEVIERAHRIVRRVPPHDKSGEIQAVWDYLIGLQGFPYRMDPVDVELLQAAPALLSGGDCDDYTIQAGAYLEALGTPVEVVVVGQKAPAPGEEPRFHHVYLRVLDRSKRQWVPFDPVLHHPTKGRFARPGDELPHAVERTYPMNAIANEPMQLGDFDFFQTIKDVGYALDFTRKDNPIRGLVSSIPGIGPAVVAGGDAMAGARKALASVGIDPFKAPASTLQTIDSTLASGGTVAPSASALAAAAARAKDPNNPANKPEGLSTGAKVGIGLGVAALVGGGIAFGVSRARKHRRGRR